MVQSPSIAADLIPVSIAISVPAYYRVTYRRPPLRYYYCRTCYRMPSPCLLLSLLWYPLPRTNPSAQPDLLPPWSFRPVVVSFLPDHCRRPPLCSIPALLLLWHAYRVTSLLPVVIVVSIPVCCYGCPVVVSLLSFLYSLLSLPNDEVKKDSANPANLYLYCHKNLTISELLPLTFYLWK